MGKSPPSPARLQEFSRVITSSRLHHHRPPPTPQISKASPPTTISCLQPANNLSRAGTRIEAKDQHSQLLLLRVENKEMMKEANISNSNSKSNSTSAAEQELRRVPLAEVVADCMKVWFQLQDTLKEAKAGDTAMQVLVSQMYYNGYVSPEMPKRAWMNRASRARSSAWKISDKHPGYNASDSDSEDTKDEAK